MEDFADVSQTTFDEHFKTEIEDMKYYLESKKLRMISFKFTDGWNFKLSINQNDWNKLHKFPKEVGSNEV